MDPENLSFHDFHRRGNKRRMLACNRSSAFHFSNVAGRKYRSESLDRTDFLCLEHCGSIHLRWHLYCQWYDETEMPDDFYSWCCCGQNTSHDCVCNTTS